MKNWGAWIRPFCALLAAMMLLAAPLDGALAAREALVKTGSATARASADGSGKAVFTLKKGARVTVTAVRGSVARITYNGKSGYLLTSCLSLSAAKAKEEEKKLLRDAVVYKTASTSSKQLGKLQSGESVQLIDTKGNWAKVQKDGQTGFILKNSFDAPADKQAEKISGKQAEKVTAKPSASRKTMTTTVDAKLFAKASQSAAYKKVEAGSKVAVIDEKGSWYKVEKSGTTGFMLKKAFAEVKPTEKPNDNSASAFKTLKTGSGGASVLKLQKRLEALGYLDIVPNGKYASTTATAVKLFQSMSGLKKSGVADGDTQSALYASNAKKSAMLSSSIKQGAKGTGVQRLQMRLRSKGYFKDKVNGVYGSSTQTAVAAYQAAAGLKEDGAAGPATLKSLYSSKAPKASSVKPAEPTPTATPKPSATSTPKPAATPKPSKPSGGKNDSGSSSKAEKVIATAKTKLGKPYVFGASGPSSYDCSGLLMLAYGTVGVSLPHSAYTIGYGIGKKVSRSDLSRGDIVCFNTISDSDLVDHVGIYLGNGSFLHASSGQGRVVISSLTGFYASAFSWGRSLF